MIQYLCWFLHKILLEGGSWDGSAGKACVVISDSPIPRTHVAEWENPFPQVVLWPPCGMLWHMFQAPQNINIIFKKVRRLKESHHGLWRIHRKVWGVAISEQEELLDPCPQCLSNHWDSLKIRFRRWSIARDLRLLQCLACAPPCTPIVQFLGLHLSCFKSAACVHSSGTNSDVDRSTPGISVSSLASSSLCLLSPLWSGCGTLKS